MSKTTKAHLNELYKDALPVPNIVPLPPLSINPASLILYLYQFLYPRVPAHQRIRGILNEETLSVWVTHNQSADRLWRSGFFGKGQFSRSEPSWYTRTQRALGLIGKDEQVTAEELVARRRTQRAEMKAQRARREREEVLATLRAEGRSASLDAAEVPAEETQPLDLESSEAVSYQDSAQQEEKIDDEGLGDGEEVLEEGIPNIEYLQLTLHEALFLGLALDVMDVQDSSGAPILKSDLLSTCTNISRHLSFKTPDTTPLDAQFLIQYAVYHHYRSLGWTVKSGIKFGVDWLLYKRGPVFSHAEFSIVVIPSPIQEAGEETREEKPWWWIHTLARVNGQVKKTVILAFVEFHAEQVRLDGLELKELLSRYRVREVSLRRWIPSRNRD